MAKVNINDLPEEDDYTLGKQKKSNKVKKMRKDKN